MLGHIENGQIVKAQGPKITCQCVRVPVLNGHTGSSVYPFCEKAVKRGTDRETYQLPGIPAGRQSFQARRSSSSATWKRMTVRRLNLDVDYEHGMGVSIGRLREDSIYDYKFIGLSHNTIRGAAGGAVLCAEALTAKGYIQAK